MQTTKWAVAVAALTLTSAWAAPTPKKQTAPLSKDSVFYVYSDKSAPGNHYIPSGWMGDYGDLKIDDGNTSGPADGRTAIKITYSGEAKQGANWAGMFWQNPANNWGDKLGGYDLSAYKRLTFWARGEKGGETINEFKVGGITGEHADSDAASMGPVELTKDWKKYTLDLSDKNLSKIIGGFCWATSRDNNPDGLVMYLDEIRFEK